jgi:8-amino-3,8-dideoxy-alpha-D-manno-octulosonate transaminase
MSELQGAIGLVQLEKLPMIIQRQRDNKQRLKDRLQALPVKFRQIPDPAGDCGDTLVFFLNSREQAATFARKMGEAGLGTKNLPDAIRWHFARHWQHMFTEHGFYQDTYATAWQQSADLLERSIALPIMVKMTPEQIDDQAEKLTRIAQEIL